MRVVIDCNVLVAAAWVDGTCRRVIDTALRQHEIVLSAPVWAEYRAVARRPKPARFRDSLEANMAEVARLAIFVEPADVVFGLSDPDDEVYLATAMEGGAVLITGNRRDFVKQQYGPVEVCSPRSFLNRPIETSEPEP